MPLFIGKSKNDDPCALSQDAQLVEKAVNGDQAAFGELVEKYSSFVYRTVFFDIKNREDAEDISQEVFIKAYKALASFRYDSEFTTWLYRICKNTVYDHIRKASRNKAILFSEFSSDEDDREYEVPDTSGSYEPEKSYIKKETADMVNAAIATLSDEHRDIIIMRDIEGMSYTQISDALSLEEGTVKSRLSRARAALKKKLEHSGLL